MKIAYTVTGACVVHQSNPTQRCTQGCPTVDSWENFQAGWLVLGGDVVQAQVTDARGNSTTERFDSNRTTATSEDAQGQPTQITRDPVTRNVTRMVDVMGRSTRYAYDSDGRQIASADALGRLSETSYDAIWKKPQVTTRYLDDGIPISTTRSYDNLTGNLLTTTNPLGHTTSFTSTVNGQLETITNPLGHVTRLEYNSAGDLFKSTNPLGHVVNLSIDVVGRATSVTDPLGLTNTISFDGLDRIIETIDPMQGKTMMTYGVARDRDNVTDARRQVILRTAHDVRHRVIERLDAANAKTSYRYNVEGSLIGITDRKGQVTALDYDEQNRVIRGRAADGGARRMHVALIGARRFAMPV